MPADARLTIKTLREMAATMLRIYPPLAEKVGHFEQLVVHHFRDEDVDALKRVIIDTLEAMMRADQDELRQVSALQIASDPRAQLRLRNIIATVHAQLIRIQTMERDVKDYERAPSAELTRAINRLVTDLGELLRKEDEELREMDEAA